MDDNNAGLTNRLSKETRIAVLMCIAILATTSVPVIYRMGIGFAFWPPLTRPTGVPKTAYFVSTFKEETWFDCRVDQIKDVDVCQAWDANGRLLTSGEFRLEDEDRAAKASELRPSQVAPLSENGKLQMIYLYGSSGEVSGRVLIPVVNGKRMGVPHVSVNP